MKKILFFLITILGITFFQNINVFASTANFYEGEYINGIYMNKRAQGSKTIYYQKARFFRQTGTNTPAYCIEPFNFFSENGSYQSTVNPNNLTAYQKERISKIAHFGYGYPGRTEEKWYAITQMMIWKEADPNGDFYFTDKLNGTRINAYVEEMNQINNSIYLNDITPSIIGKEYKLVEGESLNITDTNNVLNNYVVSNNIFKIENNKLQTNKLKEGVYETNIIKNNNIHNSPVIFYQSPTSQDLVIMGDIDNKNFNIKVKVIKTSIEITKIDSITKDTKPTGDAKLENAIYQIYDSNLKEIDKITIDENCKGMLNNLKFGKYYIKEIKPGTGYTLDDKMYEFEITEDNPNIKLSLENKVIETNIEINKQYGDKEMKSEPNITFEIYDKNNNLVKTIITDEFGEAKFTLPYGKYKVKQINSTKGYQKVDDFEIIIDSNKDQTFNLTDIKIKVPNTGIDNNNLLNIIGILIFICLKKLV